MDHSMDDGFVMVPRSTDAAASALDGDRSGGSENAAVIDADRQSDSNNNDSSNTNNTTNNSSQLQLPHQLKLAESGSVALGFSVSNLWDDDSDLRLAQFESEVDHLRREVSVKEAELQLERSNLLAMQKRSQEEHAELTARLQSAEDEKQRLLLANEELTAELEAERRDRRQQLQ